MTATRRESGSRWGRHGRTGHARLIWVRAVFVLVALVGALGPLPAAAHPLGNFSISHYAAIRIARDIIELRYIIDMAEIPTFQEIQDTGFVPQAGDPGLEKFLARKAEALKEGLLLEVNGQRLSLKTESKEVIFPVGAGGLPTMKIGILYRAMTNGNGVASKQGLYYRDGNFPGRAGWKEIIALEDSGIKFLSSSAPRVDRSSQLSDYPADLLNSPPQALEARVVFASKEVPAPLAAVSTTIPAFKGRDPYEGSEEFRTTDSNFRQSASDSSKDEKTLELSVKTIPHEVKTVQLSVATQPMSLQANRQATPRSSFTELIATKELSLGILLFALAVAVGLGAFHALEPGHGKTLVAAYLVGSRGTMRHALWLGLIVTGAHTAGVYLLGGVTLYASQYVVPERLYPWLGLTSGVMITSLGLFLFLRRYLRKDNPFSHHHDHAHHSHGSGHDHSHAGHSHHHHEPSREVSRRELLALGISGGIVPCPAALVVLLSAVSMQRIGFGLLLIVAFSVGLAAVLIAIGLLMVYARRSMSRFQMNSRLTTRWLPLTSSAFIILFGVALTVQALQTAAILRIQL
jgi:ABC-type nickel/cobalt efflux system permease component RcnA